MNLRERQELFEKEHLSPCAAKSAESAGRARKEPKCDIRTEFQRDRDRITHSKSFRRLMHKTQVFISPEGDHYRTRLSHTLEVAQIARTISRALRLNEDLTEAIALGHDLGHTPFGHTGEDALNELLPGGFRHNVQSVRVVELLENSGEGLNLTREVVNGILNHKTIGKPSTLEGAVVQISDKIGYINHDIDDAVRAGILTNEELPRDCTALLGSTSSARINNLIRSVIAYSIDKPEIGMNEEFKDALFSIREFMYKTVYQSQLQQIERSKIKQMLGEIHRYYTDDPSRLPCDYKKLLERENNVSRIAGDYIAGMTDRFALKLYVKIYLPSGWGL